MRNDLATHSDAALAVQDRIDRIIAEQQRRIPTRE